MKKSVAIFGSTGTIGKNALEVIRNHRDKYQVEILAAGKDFKTLAQQIRDFSPKYAVISNINYYQELKKELSASKSKTEILAGTQEINNLANIKVDFFLAAIVGIASLIPVLNAIRAGSNIGMANKECLVAAGNLILKEASRSGSKILPIDSEHNAIFQIFEKQNLQSLDKIILTASGGPFLNYNLQQMQNITKEDAIKHPNWKMGAKISVDSATMVNKSLEVIEAYHLFLVQKEQIEIVIHPQSIVHGLAQYEDGSTLAMLSLPDMKVPISYALSYPKRIKINHQQLKLAEIARLDFFSPDMEKFPILKILPHILKSDGNAPCIFNMANEIAVEQFLQDKIKFSQITQIIDFALQKIPFREISSLQDIIEETEKVKRLLTM